MVGMQAPPSLAEALECRFIFPLMNIHLRFAFLFLFIALAGTGCVQTVEPSAEDELLMKAEENVQTMPSG